MLINGVLNTFLPHLLRAEVRSCPPQQFEKFGHSDGPGLAFRSPRPRGGMVVLAGLEVVFGAAAASALGQTENGRWMMERARAAARSLGQAAPEEEEEEEEAAATAAAAAVGGPARVTQRLRSLRLPELRGPPALAAEERVLRCVPLLEQLSNAVPRRYGDAGDAWHLLFSSALHGRHAACS